MTERPSTTGASSEQDPQKDGRTGTLVRGLAILDVLTSTQQPLSMADIAASTGLDQSTTLRLLRALEESEYVIRNEESKRFLPSPRLLRPLPLLHPIEQMRRESDPVLRSLSARVRRTALLVLFVGSERLVLDIAMYPGSLVPYYGNWLRGPLHATAGGKLVLLSMQEDRRQAMAGPEPFEAATPCTLTQWKALEENLVLCAQRGFAVSHGEHRLGVTEVAAPIRSWTGAIVGCLVAGGNSSELEGDAINLLGAEVKQSSELLVFNTPSLEAARHFCGR